MTANKSYGHLAEVWPWANVAKHRAVFKKVVRATPLDGDKDRPDHVAYFCGHLIAAHLAKEGDTWGVQILAAPHVGGTAAVAPGFRPGPPP